MPDILNLICTLIIMSISIHSMAVVNHIFGIGDSRHFKRRALIDTKEY